MKITCKQLNPHSCLTYMIGIEGTDSIILIDPVLDHVHDYVSMLERENMTLTHVIDTHTHADHISGCAALKDMTGCKYFMHKNSPSKCADSELADGAVVTFFEGLSAAVIYSPGHTRDSVSLVLTDMIFTGDALFLDDGGAGRDDLPGGDSGAHWDTLKHFTDLSDSLTVFPAHDYRNRKPSTLARQKLTNPHLKERTREEFIAYIEDLKLGPADWMKDVLKANYACARDPKAAWIPVDQPACEVKGTLDPGINELPVTAISAAELSEKISSGHNPLLLDVREVKELNADLGHIDGVVNIPVWLLSHRLDELEQEKQREIITVCRSGSRAYTAAQILNKAGFDNVSVLNGGMIAWNKR